MKRLFIDVETSPNIVTSWRIGWKINLSPDNIIEERKIICGSWKWEGKKKIYNKTWDAKQDDKKLVQTLADVCAEADEIVYQNGDRFDLPWIKTRAIYHGIKMYPKYQTFDTLKKIRSNFYFNSNRLDYVQRFLGGKGKVETGGFDLWKKVHLNNDRKALKHMVKYCDGDITELEDLYRKVAPYVVHNTHTGVIEGLPNYTCPHCGSYDLSLSKTRVTAMGGIRKQMQCKDCTGYFTISGSLYKKYLKETS